MELGYEDNIINENLKKLNLPTLAVLSPNEKGYIRNAEQLFIKVNNERKDALRKYRELKITVKFVAENLRIERQTIYNNHVLNEYIKNAQVVQINDDIFDKINSIQRKLKGLEQDLLLLFKRDVNIEHLKYDIDDLNIKLLEKENEIEELELRNELNLSKIQNSEKLASVNKKNIYKFK